MRIFVSYSRKDADALNQLVTQITETYPNDNVWYDKSIQGGDDWWQRILTEIRQSTIFLYLVSQTSLDSSYCQDELREALKQDKAVLPVFIEELFLTYPRNFPDDLAIELKKIQYVNLVGSLSDAQAMTRLWAAINQLQRSSHKTQRIQLSRVERWILSNQFAILAELKTEDTDTYHTMQEIVERGYEWEYENITQYIYDDRFTMRRDECLEVIDILDMFSVLSSTYEELVDKSGIERWQVEFIGFSGNEETKYMAYVRFLVERPQKFNWLVKDKRFNSHMPTLDRYRKMLKKWKNSREQYNLTKDDIIRIIDTSQS